MFVNHGSRLCLALVMLALASLPARAETIAIVIGGDELSAEDSEAIADVVDPWVGRHGYKLVTRILDVRGVGQLVECFVRKADGCSARVVASAGVDRLLFFLVSRGAEGTILSTQLFAGNGALEATADGACRECSIPELALVTQRLVRAVWGMPVQPTALGVSVAPARRTSTMAKDDDELIAPKTSDESPAPARTSAGTREPTARTRPTPTSRSKRRSPRMEVADVGPAASSEAEAKSILARADLLMERGKLAEADSEYARVARSSFLPSVGLLGQAAIAFERKAFDDAAKLAHAALRAGADGMRAGLLRGTSLVRAGRSQEAAQVYRALLKRATGRDQALIKAALEQIAADCPSCATE